MADLISQKVMSYQNVSPSKTYTPPAERKEVTAEEKTFREKLRDNKTNIIAGGLITGGAILLYLGLTRPGKNDIFDKYINGRIEEMVSIVDKFSDFAGKKIESAFKKSLSYITKYKETYIINPKAYTSKLEPADTPQKVMAAQDTAFGRLYQIFNGGMKSSKDDFSVLFQRIKYEVMGEVSGQQNRTALALKDYLSLPHGNNFAEDMLQEVEAHLDSKQKSLLDFMERLKNTKINIAENFQFGQLANAITESRLSGTRTKEALLDTAFGKIRQMLSLDKGFEPMYKQRRYDLSEIKSLDEYLKPTKSPDEVMQNFEQNVFMDILEKTDLGKMSEDEVRRAFYRMPKDYNLKDLRYLIDRIRLHGVVAAAEKADGGQAGIYKALEVKLEYLSNILNDFGEKELLRCCGFDIEKLNPDQIEGCMAHLSKASRRLGYENFSIMNREMLKTSEDYAKLKLSNYAEMIEDNPKKFFVG